jgi:hypothetical protein
MHVSAAGAMRFNRDHSVAPAKAAAKKKRTATNNPAPTIMATPLVGGKSALLPDPLRLAPFPFPNADHDCIVQFNVLEAKKLVEHVYSLEEIVIDGTTVKVVQSHKPKQKPGRASLVWNDAESVVNQHILSQVFFMLTVSRFTGVTQILSKYSGLGLDSGTGMHLPVMSEWEDFGHFLTAVDSDIRFNSFISTQHKQSIPAEMHKTERLVMLLQSLAKSDKGCKRLGKFLSANGVARRTRVALMECLMNCIAHCGDIQGSHEELGFVSHKIIADVESVFLDLVGPVTMASVVLGWGSSQGIDCLLLPEEHNNKTKAERFEFFHSWLLEHLSQEEHASLAKACGWELADDELVSIWYGRPFSHTDTEHILCKIWLAILHSHASRNVSEDKDISVGHCYPLCEEGEWEADLRPHMLAMWEAFLDAKKKNGGDDYQYPIDIMFDSERRKLV